MINRFTYRRKNTIPVIERKHIIVEYKKGLSAREIGRKFNHSHGTITNIIRDEGLEIRNTKTYKFIEPEEKLFLINDYNNGLSLSSLAEKYNYSADFCRKVLTDNKISIRIENFSDETIELIIDCYNRGLPCSKIATKFSCANETIRRILVKEGIERRCNSFRHQKDFYNSKLCDEIVNDYLSTMTRKEICEKYDCSSALIDEILKKKGITPNKLKKFNSAIRYNIAKAYTNGVKNDDICKQFNCGRKVIYNTLAELGLDKIKVKPIIPEKEIKNLVCDYKKGLFLSELGEKYNCSGETCRKYLKDAGIHIFTKKERAKQPRRYKQIIIAANKASEQPRSAPVSPNKTEIYLQELLNEWFPNEFKFVGGGEVVLGGKFPDFINVNGKKQIIELYGDYWHGKKLTGRTKKEEENQRIEHFEKYGYQTLIIWEHELKDLDSLKVKFNEFCHTSF